GGASGSMKKITRSQIEQERVPVPPMTEQQRIVGYLAERMAAAETTRKALQEQLADINALPAALLIEAA
ncbi:MAG TPA: restriction endonuclease subunit S, partial [Thermoleophilia bacterium]|nr:restriction endonuclease subunit S [Thermoleophilia bacterium]